MKKVNKWEISDVKAIVMEVANRSDEYEFLNCMEVAYNGRLSRSLARCLTRNTLNRGKIVKAEPYKLEFGKTILNVESHETLRQVVLHEVAHAIANKRHVDNCGHDKRFKAVCTEIGCTDSGATTKTSTSVEEIRRASDKVGYKHKITCNGCGSTHYYTRATKIVNAIKNGSRNYYCPKCKNDEFTYTQLR